MEQQRDQYGNVVRKEGFTQVCVWPATVVCNCEDGFKPEKAQEFEKYMLEELNCRVQYLEEIETTPDTDKNGEPVPDTGGRNDVFFAMHKDDVEKAAVRRLAYGIRWLEDVLAPVNYPTQIYPNRVRHYQTWPMDGTEIEGPCPCGSCTDKRAQSETETPQECNIMPQTSTTQPMKRRNTMSKVTDNIRDTLKRLLEHKVERAMQEIDLEDMIENALGQNMQRNIENALQSRIEDMIQDEVQDIVDEVLDEVIDEALDN